MVVFCGFCGHAGSHAEITTRAEVRYCSQCLQCRSKADAPDREPSE